MFVRSWAFFRRLQYIVGFTIFLSTIGVIFYFVGFYNPANCFDGEKNGDEHGIDCGGSCVPFCVDEVSQPEVVWAKSFKIAEGRYNAVAYIENSNYTAGSPEMSYTFEFYDRSGEKIGERSGVTVLPPNSSYPIFEGRIYTEEGVEISETKLVLDMVETWLPAAIDRDQLKSIDINMTGSDYSPKLYVDMENTGLEAAENIEVVATIFNQEGFPVTTSQTLIEHIDARSTQEITFTWPSPIAKTVRSCIIPTDVALAIDLSGSMNNDGGDPPQPVTAALLAAAEFVSNLQEDDQVALVTFASNAILESNLTTNNQTVKEKVLGLEIDQVEETGYTNTLAALEVAAEELNSEYHNLNARRVLVLLTDGLPTVEGDTDIVSLVEQKARLLDNDDITIYAIGLGADADMSFVQNIASTPGSAYFAPTGADLDEIYTEITSSLCEVGATKIDIIAKTETTFASLK